MTSILNDSSGGASMGASTHWGMAEHERRHHRLLLPAETCFSSPLRSVDHVLMFCPLVWRLWSQMVSWWDQSSVITGSIEDLLLWWSGGKLKSWVFKMWKIAPLVMLWSVWKMRNECLFKVAQTNFEVLCAKVKVQIAFWTKVNMEVDYSIHDIVSNLHQIRFSS
ncbi:hypothetical protein CsSME_00005300 [Camellia sinensis var. sinensis]